MNVEIVILVNLDNIISIYILKKIFFLVIIDNRDVYLTLTLCGVTLWITN